MNTKGLVLINSSHHEKTTDDVIVFKYLNHFHLAGAFYDKNQTKIQKY